MSASALTLATPSLGQRAFLAQCLAHVAKLPGLVEHVVMDGGSTDGSVAVLRAHQAQATARFAFASEPDRGMYDALNKGFAMARSDVLGYLNCDDLLLTWAVPLILARFDAADGPDVVYGDALEWDPVSGRAALVVQPPTWMLPRFLRAGGHLAQPAVFFRRALFERLGGFDPSFRLLGDHDLWLRALQAGALFARVDEVLAVQRVVEGQLMQRHAQLVDTERARCFRRAGLRTPGAAARRGANLMSALLHRRGLLALWQDLVLQGRRGEDAPWQRTLAAGLLRAPAGRLVHALLRSTRGRALLHLDPRTLADLTGVPDLARGVST